MHEENHEHAHSTGDHGHHDHDHDHGHDHADHHEHDDHAHAHSSGGHGHSHASTSERRLTWALAITAVFLVVEVVGALASHSLALFADAGHMLTDAASLVLALFALRAARRPADAVYSFGHHRLQVLAAFVNGLALLAISLWILFESVERLLTPQIVEGRVMLVIAALGVGANLGAFLVLRHSHDSINMRAAILHVVSDLLGSLAAMIAAIMILGTGFMPVDPLLSALVSLLILRGGWRVTQQSAHILLEGSPPGLDAGEVTSDLLAQVPGLTGVHHVHAWSLTDERPMLTLHAVLREGADRDATLLVVLARLRKRFGIAHATVQLEAADCVAGSLDPGCA